MFRMRNGVVAALSVALIAVTGLPPNISVAEAAQVSDAEVAATVAHSEPNSDPVLCAVDYLSVPENAGGGVVTGWLDYGDIVVVEPLSDKIWAGVWLTGENGPEGWLGTSAPSDYPLPGKPEYSLIARIGNGSYQYVGNSKVTLRNTKPGYRQRVRFRVNDNRPGNGSGAFRVFLDYGCE